METVRPIRVMVVDDHRIICDALARAIRSFPDLELAGQSFDGVEAVKQYAELEPDVVLMDAEMPIMTGVEATWIIRENFPQACIIILSAFRDNAYLWAASEAGAVAYVDKTSSIEDLITTVRRAHESCLTDSKLDFFQP